LYRFRGIKEALGIRKLPEDLALANHSWTIAHVAYGDYGLPRRNQHVRDSEKRVFGVGQEAPLDQPFFVLREVSIHSYQSAFMSFDPIVFRGSNCFDFDAIPLRSSPSTPLFSLVLARFIV
jgi:hypothetical protein